MKELIARCGRVPKPRLYQHFAVKGVGQQWRLRYIENVAAWKTENRVWHEQSEHLQRVAEEDESRADYEIHDLLVGSVEFALSVQESRQHLLPSHLNSDNDAILAQELLLNDRNIRSGAGLHDA